MCYEVSQISKINLWIVILQIYTLSWTLLSCNSYVWALSFTFGKLCVDGVDSKLVLNRESISVDFPRPVSPENMAIKQYKI